MYTRIKRSVCNIIRDDGHRSYANRIFSNGIMALIIINVVFVILDLLEVFGERGSTIFYYIEAVSVAIFTTEYILRLWTADLLYPRFKPAKARLKYALSPMAIIDIVAIIPFYLPLAFPINMTILRLLRLLRLLRIMKLNRYSDAKTSEMVLASIKEAIVLLDTDHNFLSANESASHLFPSLRTIKKYAHVSQVENWPSELIGFDENSTKDSIGFDADNHHYRANISKIYDRERLLRYIIIIQDITESVLLEKAEKELTSSRLALLEISANMDTLTGIHNRRYFMETSEIMIKEAAESGTGAYLIIFDLDHFKSVNDTYGHPGGDKVLTDVAKRVKSTVRHTDLFARYGGEEFVLLLTGLSEEAVRERAERMRTSICSTPIVFESTEIPVSASFGVAPVNGGDFESSISFADQALYTAKEEGRNRVVFYK